MGRGNSLWRSACPILWSNPILFTLFHEDCPLCAPLRPKTQEHQSTCVDSWVHRVPENVPESLANGSAGNLTSNGVQLAQYCGIKRRSFKVFWRRSPPLYSLALRLRNSKVPVWTHESIGYPKMDISHWDAAIHYGVQLAQYCDHNPILLRYFTKIAPSVLPCPKAQEHQGTCVDSWVHRVPENSISHWARGNSLWRSACPILWSNPGSWYAIWRSLPPSVLPLP